MNFPDPPPICVGVGVIVGVGFGVWVAVAEGVIVCVAVGVSVGTAVAIGAQDEMRKAKSRSNFRCLIMPSFPLNI